MATPIIVEMKEMDLVIDIMCVAHAPSLVMNADDGDDSDEIQIADSTDFRETNTERREEKIK